MSMHMHGRGWMCVCVCLYLHWIARICTTQWISNGMIIWTTAVQVNEIRLEMSVKMSALYVLHACAKWIAKWRRAVKLYSKINNFTYTLVRCTHLSNQHLIFFCKYTSVWKCFWAKTCFPPNSLRSKSVGRLYLQ